MGKREFGTMIKLEQGGAAMIIDCESDRARRAMQTAVDAITESPQFRAAEICRARFERAKILRQYDQCRFIGQQADALYRMCRGRIKSQYTESLRLDKDHNYIDITPFGVLIDEINFALQSIQNYY